MPAQVDVVIPAYNAAATLREAIDSIRAQTLRDIRIIVIDDGSTDDTPALLAELTKQDERILVISQANGGIVSARNAALRRCEAVYIACLDADDTAFPDRLERQLAYLDAHPACVAVGGGVEHVDEHGAPLSGLQQSGPPSEADAGKVPALEPYIVQSTLMVRRAAVEVVGGYRSVPNSEDSDLYWRLAELGALVNLPETFGKYRVHTASASSSNVNGRVMAVGSQLIALSALRRAAKRADIVFRPELLSALKAAATLAAMTDLAARDLDADEAEHLRIGAGAKLMEMARYRPYELDVADCAFIRATLPSAKRLTAQNQKEVTWYITVTAGRLMRKGLWREAMALTPPKDLPLATARMLLAR